MVTVATTEREEGGRGGQSGDPLAALRESAASAECASLIVVEPPRGQTPAKGSGMGQGGWSNDFKSRLLRKWLRTVSPSQLVLFVDGFGDTLFSLFFSSFIRCPPPSLSLSHLI